MVSLCLIVRPLAAVLRLESEDTHFGEMIQTNSQETYHCRFKFINNKLQNIKRVKTKQRRLLMIHTA